MTGAGPKLFLPAAALLALLASGAAASTGTLLYDFQSLETLELHATGVFAPEEAQALRHQLDADKDGEVSDSETEALLERERTFGARLTPPGGRLRMDGHLAVAARVKEHGYDDLQGAVDGRALTSTWLFEYTFPNVTLDANSTATFTIAPRDRERAGSLLMAIESATVRLPPGLEIAATGNLPFGSSTSSDGRRLNIGVFEPSGGPYQVVMAPSSGDGSKGAPVPLAPLGAAALLAAAAARRARGRVALACAVALVAAAGPALAAGSEGPARIVLVDESHVTLRFEGSAVGGSRLVRNYADSDGNGTVNATEAHAYVEYLLGWFPQGAPVDSPAGELRLDGALPTATHVDLSIEGLVGEVVSDDTILVLWDVRLEFAASDAAERVLTLDPSFDSLDPQIEHESTAVRIEAGPGWTIRDAAKLPLFGKLEDGRVSLPGLDGSMGEMSVVFAPAKATSGWSSPGLAGPFVLLGALLLAGRRLSQDLA